MTQTDNQVVKKPYRTPELREHGSLVEQTKTNPPNAGNINEAGKVTPPQGDNPEKKTAST